MKRVSMCLAVVALLLGPVGQIRAGLIPLYHPTDTMTDGSDPGPVNYLTLFQALNNVQIAGIALNYDPGPGNAIPGYSLSIINSDMNGDLLGDLFSTGGYNPPLGSPDPGFGTYEFPADVSLQAGNYYVVHVQSNNDPNAIALDRGPALPFITTDANFEVDGSVTLGGVIYTNLVAEFSLDVVPEPSTFTLLGIGIAALGGYSWRRRKQAAT